MQETFPGRCGIHFREESGSGRRKNEGQREGVCIADTPYRGKNESWLRGSVINVSQLIIILSTLQTSFFRPNSKTFADFLKKDMYLGFINVIYLMKSLDI